MLHLMTGPDRLVLTKHLLREVCSRADRGQEGNILVVPEQYSHETERLLCTFGGPKISRFAEVLTFSRMADRVAASYGGAARAYLDKGGRIMAMALAAEQVASRIKLYAAVLRRPEFLVDLVRMVEEFGSYRLTPEDLLAASKRASGQFAQKLEELGLLYEAYRTVCQNGKGDPAGKNMWLRDMLEVCPWAEGKRFYFDGFSDFTAAELAVAETLLDTSAEVEIALTVNPRQEMVTRISAETALGLRQLAARRDLPCREQRLEEQTARDPGVQFLLDNLFGGPEGSQGNAEAVTLSAFDSPEEECEAAVLAVKALLAGGARCRDIAIAYPEGGVYEAPLQAALTSVELPFYQAGSDDLLGKPFISGVLSSLQAAVGPMDYSDAALYLKSALPLLPRDLCDRLDCYAYRWNLHGSQWEHPWEFHPRGFGEEWSDEDRAALQALNHDQQLAMEPLLTLRKALRQAANTGEMVTAVYEFMEQLQVRRRLEQEAAAVGGQAAQELLQMYEILLQSLEQLWLTLGETVRAPEDFVKLCRTILSQYQVGTIPAALDQIYVGALQELRHKEVPHLLVLGAADGSFPAYRTAAGLLTEEERRALLAQGLSLAPLRADQIDREMGQIASALSAATESLWLSYAGEQPAWLWRRAASLLPGSVKRQKAEIFLDLPAYAAWRLRHGDPSTPAVAGLEPVEQALEKKRSYAFTPLDPQTVQGLYGRQIYLSASRIDKYAACRFAFFLTYGIKAEPRRQATMDASSFGTFVHAVLQNTVERVMAEGGFHEIPVERLMAIATDEIDDYAQKHFPRQAQRAAYLFRRSHEEILSIVEDLGRELRVSGFQPASCELEFSGGGQLPPIVVEGEKASCRISGFVDRVDLYERDGKTYVRVVDYKTGRKDFDYTDILNGAGLQMLIYLFALQESGGKFYHTDSLIPSGVLYFPARTEYSLTAPLPENTEVAETHRKERRRKGLIRSDDVILEAMEADADHPVFMPYEVGKKGKKGNLADSAQMALLERHILQTLAEMTDQIAGGAVGPNPVIRGQNSACRYCEYRTVCHMDLCPQERRVLAATPAEKFWEKLGEEQSHG